MKKLNHIIEKVILEISTSSLETAHSIRNNIDDFLKKDLFPQLELLFNEYPFNDEIIRFDELALDLSVEKWNDFKGFQFQIIDQLKGKIQKRITAYAKNAGDSIFGAESELKQFQRISGLTNSGRIFLYFLEFGNLPWYGKEEQIEILLQPENWNKILDDNLFFSGLSNLFETSEYAVDRFIHQFPDEIIVAYLSRKNSDFLEVIPSVLKIDAKLSASLRIVFMNLLFRISNKLFTDIVITVERVVSELLKSNGATAKKIKLNEIKDLEIIFQRIIPEPAILDTLLRKLELLTKGDIQKKVEISFTPNPELLEIPESEKTNLKIETIKEQKNYLTKFGRGIKSQPHSLNLRQVGGNLNPNRLKSENQENLSFLDQSIESVLVQNAGLILLHPFLKPFFASCKITGKQGNLPPENFDMAIQTLHFLATGNEDVFEGNLVFEKFLCGVPLKMPVQYKSLLTVSIKTEANYLLDEVIRYWPALKNTSADGLRQMFFQRDGKLIQEDSKYKLIVERKAQDILLERLSWNIAVVKLPWISKIIFTEW